MSHKPQALVIRAINAGAAALGGAAVSPSSLPNFCASCHHILPSYENWLTASHRDITCVACRPPEIIQASFLFQ